MQPNDLFSFPNLIDQVHEWASPWMTNLLPWLGVMIGLAVVFVIARGIIDYFEDKAEWAFDRENLEFEQTTFRDLFGHEKGGEMFQISRSLDELSPTSRRFVAPYISQIISGKGYQQKQKRNTFAMIEKVYPKHEYQVPELSYSANKYREEHHLTDISDKTNIAGQAV